MRNNTKTLAIVLSLTVVLAAGGAYAYIELPWRTIVPGSVVGALLSVRSMKLPDPHRAREPQTPTTEGQPQSAADLERTDTSLTVPMIAATAPPLEPVAEPIAVTKRKAPPEPVDYTRLNENVILVATTLDHFNQKLLRLIAQARAGQQLQEGQTPGAQMTTSEPSSAPELPAEPELSQ